jgi:hypothetical protein
MCDLLAEGTGKYVCVVCDFPLPDLSRAQVWETYRDYGAHGPDGPMVSSVEVKVNHGRVMSFLNLAGSLNTIGWGFQLKCPICECENVHIARTEHRRSEDSYGRAWQGRGDAVYVSMYCETGCSWDVRFGFHKGSTFMGFENAKETITDLGLILAGGDTEKLIKAYEAARSARFEFGQTPTFR